MAPAKAKAREAIILLLDVGENMSQFYEDSKTYLDSSKECIYQIIQRKLISDSPDEFALILFGCDKTENRLAKQLGDYRNIAVHKDLSKPNWDFLRSLSDEIIINSNCKADWLDAITVALDYVKEAIEYRSFESKKIVIFSNFASNVSDNQDDAIVGGINALNIDVVVIGPDVQGPTHLKSKIQSDGEELIKNIVKKLNDGIICTFRDALSELTILQRKATRPTAWNTLFTISNAIKIPISAYKKIAELTPMKWTQEVIDEPNIGIDRAKAHVKLDENKEYEIEVEGADVIKGYSFGTTIIPFGESEETMLYQSGDKGLFFIGCTPKERVPRHLLMGNGCYVVVPKGDDEVANKVLNAFIQAMYERNEVGLARRVYCYNSAATFGALFPVVNEEQRYLVFAELPFAEDEHVFKFSSLDNVEVKPEQLEVVDELMDIMDLDATEDEEEKFDVTKIYDPHEQFMLRYVCNKALYPDRALPEEICSVTSLIVKSNSEVIERCASTFDKMKKLFPLYPVEPRKRRLNGIPNGSKEVYEVDVKSDNDLALPSTSNGETSNPSSENVKAILKGGKPLHDVYQIIENLIENLYSRFSTDRPKLVEVLKSYRECSCLEDPSFYNKCINSFKVRVQEDRKEDVWETIKNENLGLISEVESAKSEVKLTEVETFWALAKEEDSFYGTLDSTNGPSLDPLDDL